MTQGVLLVLVLSVLLLVGRVQPADDVRNLVLTLEIRVAFKNAVLLSSKYLELLNFSNQDIIFLQT